MDDELTLQELRRLEAERKLVSIPVQVLETAWVREAQVEAVIDAVLAVTFGANVSAYAHARHVGEWSARIAGALSFGPDPTFARRVGALSESDPQALERIAELEHLAPYVREYQAYALEGGANPRAMSLIVAAATEFDSRIAPDVNGHAPSARAVLAAMLRAADPTARPILEALASAAGACKRVRVA